MIARRGIAHHLLASGALALLAGEARAQAPGAAATPLTDVTAPAGPTDAAPGEIVVTATRQSQAISKVPISISAFSQATMDLKGIRSFADVARFTPGVTFEEGSNNISIRGISSDAGAGTTGIYIDDTPIQIRGLGFSSDNSLPAIFDLERVEVLRGPQGTLFGAGSEGGTVRYITPQPSLTEYQTYDRAEVSSTEHGAASYEIGSAIGGPIVRDRLGFRVSAWHRRDGGYIDHVDNQSGRIDAHDINHGDVTVLRGALAWEPAAGLRITPGVYYQKRSTHASDNFFVGISDPGDGRFRTSTPEYRGTRDRFVLPTLNAKYDFGGVSLIANSSYFRRKNLTGYSGTLYDLSYYQSCYLDGCGFNLDAEGNDTGIGFNGSTDEHPGPLYPFLTPTGIDKRLPYYKSPSVVTNTQRVFTQEVRLQSNDPGARFNWVVGLFYQHSRQRSTEELVDPLGDAFFNAVSNGEYPTLESFFGAPLYGRDSYINNSVAKDSQIAGFVNATYAITDKLKITAGARYAKTKFSVKNFADGSQNGGHSPDDADFAFGKSSDKPFTPKIGVSYQADQRNLFYASWSKGFRAAGANPPVPFDPCAGDLRNLGLPDGAPITYKSDTVKSVEAGSKNKLFDNKLTIDASIYQVKWDNIQQIVNLPSCAIRFIGNLGKARSRGFDLQGTIAPVHGLTVDAAIGYTNTRYTEDATLAAGGDVVVNDGDAIEGAPWTVSVGAQYDFPIGANTFYMRGDVEYKSRLKRATTERDPNSANYDAALIAPAASTFVSLRAGALVDHANISLFVDNLLDSAPQLGYTHQDSDTLLFENATFRPRTVGLTISYRR